MLSSLCHRTEAKVSFAQNVHGCQMEQQFPEVAKSPSILAHGEARMKLRHALSGPACRLLS
eukprot:6182366-Pleurochrysis_carterae.AAC.1